MLVGSIKLNHTVEVLYVHSLSPILLLHSKCTLYTVWVSGSLISRKVDLCPGWGLALSLGCYKWQSLYKSDIQDVWVPAIYLGIIFQVFFRHENISSQKRRV